MTSTRPAVTAAPTRAAAAALWLLPVYGLLLMLSTLTHEPDHTEDFAAWSRYVTTDVFVVSHLVGSILGAGLGLVGVMAALVLLVRGPAPVAATVGAAMTVLGNVCFTSVFAAAAYAQPAIGRAYLAGRPGAEDLYDDVYGTPLLVMFGVGALFFVAGAVVLGRAVARTAPGLRWAGYAYAASLVLFLVAGFTVAVVQPVAGAAVAVAATVIARRLPASVAGPRP